MDDRSNISDAADRLIAKFIERLSPEPVCDTCVAARLDVADLETVARATLELAGMGGFERSKLACSLCGDIRMTTRRR
jgi:hypothetical protein